MAGAAGAAGAALVESSDCGLSSSLSLQPRKVIEIAHAMAAPRIKEEKRFIGVIVGGNLGTVSDAVPMGSIFWCP